MKRSAAVRRKAGADVVFVELKNSPTILDDLKRVTSGIDAPCLVNIDGGGKLGKMNVPEIEALGFRIAILGIGIPIPSMDDAVLALLTV